jgi:hypothetical protein
MAAETAVMTLTGSAARAVGSSPVHAILIANRLSRFTNLCSVKYRVSVTSE